MASVKYVVTLTGDEREDLLAVVDRGRAPATQTRHANILLAVDRGEHAGPGMTDAQAAAACHSTTQTVRTVKRQFVEEGLGRAIRRKRRERPSRVKIDGEAEAKIVAPARADPPEGHARWTPRPVAEKSAGPGHSRARRPRRRRRPAKKNEPRPWVVEEWCVPEHGAEFVAAMEDVPAACERPYDPARPVVCPGESSRQLVGEFREGLPTRPGGPGKRDYQYAGNGVADVLVALGPLANTRRAIPARRRGREGLARVVRHICDETHPGAERAVLVMDDPTPMARPRPARRSRRRRRGGSPTARGSTSRRGTGRGRTWRRQGSACPWGTACPPGCRTTTRSAGSARHGRTTATRGEAASTGSSPTPTPE